MKSKFNNLLAALIASVTILNSVAVPPVYDEVVPEAESNSQAENIFQDKVANHDNGSETSPLCDDDPAEILDY